MPPSRQREALKVMELRVRQARSYIAYFEEAAFSPEMGEIYRNLERAAAFIRQEIERLEKKEKAA